jgi:hypothetical protein
VPIPAALRQHSRSDFGRPDPSLLPTSSDQSKFSVCICERFFFFLCETRLPVCDVLVCCFTGDFSILQTQGTYCSILGSFFWVPIPFTFLCNCLNKTRWIFQSPNTESVVTKSFSLLSLVFLKTRFSLFGCVVSKSNK